MHDHPWHSFTVQETGEKLACDPERGLDHDEAARRLDLHGPNALPEAPPRPLILMFLDQFKGLLTAVLAGAAVLAGLIGDVTDMAVIFCVVLFNACLGLWQEHRANRVLDALRAMLAPQTRVRRAGEKTEIAAAELVPGDVVLLEAGDRVPADGRLVRAHGLEIDESVLTGESVAAAKHTDIVEASAALADRTNQAFMNSVVTRGRGELLVTQTGAATQMGRIAGLLAESVESRTPLQERLDQLGRRLAALAGAVVLVILVTNLLRGEDWATTVLTAIALAVAAIPEGLPAVVTVTLAIGMYRMARRGAIVKKLAAVETLGCTDVICSDKTGTLTQNRMEAVEVWIVAEDALLPAKMCNDARLDGDRVIGDPTEGALLALAEKSGVTGDLPRLAELPFDSARKFMLTVHRDEGGLVLFAKGAPDVVAHLCADYGDEARAQAERMAGQALRVLALARKRVGEEALADPLAAAHGMELTALVGLMDPPRLGAAEAIAACKAAGITVKMITGDHRITAAAIARRLGLEGEVLTGAELDRLDDAQLAERVDAIAVFARVAPEHKLRIVSALRARGHVAAMTGDGVNDAPSLRGAHMGIAMGRTGCDVTREAATMVLTDDDFPTVVRAVAEGRVIYDNIVKFVRFQLSTNMGALLSVLAAPFLGLPVPFHPIQILWVNIIMDGPPAMALAFDPARRGLMEEKPRPPEQPILSARRLARLAAYGATMAVGTLGLFWWGMRHGDLDQARTLAFTTFVLFQFFNVFNARVSGESALGRRMFTNSKLWVALAGVVGLQVLAVHWGPAQAIFHTTDLSLEQWGLATLVASSVLVLDEVRKLVTRRF